MNDGAYFLIVFAIIIVAVILQHTGTYPALEHYSAAENPYKYNLIDSNPVRRVSSFFDTCSPENMQDCSRNNPYEGLPLP
jgi:hypothetical protein